MTGADSASTAFPTAPDGPTLADVMESAAAAAGLESASNRLEIPAHRRVVVVVIDGLGSSILKRYGAHAPFLKSQAGRSRRIRTVFPTTTASAAMDSPSASRMPFTAPEDCCSTRSTSAP